MKLILELTQWGQYELSDGEDTMLFETAQKAFDWIQTNVGPCTVEISIKPRP